MNPHYLCLKSSKAWQCKKGKVYVHEVRPGWDELVNYTRRFQNRLLNGSLMLQQPGLFLPVSPYDVPLRGVLCDCDECREERKQPRINTD